MIKNSIEMIKNLENIAESELAIILSPLLSITSSLLNLIPTITNVTKRKTFDKSELILSLIQHIFLKQAAVSLRTISLLLLRGYTLQAGVIASSLFEIYLLSTYIGSDYEKAKKYHEHPNSQDWVWHPSDMVKYIARKKLERVKPDFTQEELKSEIDLEYGLYVYLCSLKHINPIPIWHTSTTSVSKQLRDLGFTSLNVIPDIRPEDTVVKVVILSSANQKTAEIAINVLHTSESITVNKVAWFQLVNDIQKENLNITRDMYTKHGSMPYPTIPRDNYKQNIG